MWPIVAVSVPVQQPSQLVHVHTYQGDMTLVYLPCDSEQWPEDKKYFRALSAIKSVEELQRAIDDNDKYGDTQITTTAERWRCLRGLSVFMATAASESEREEFFVRTLPFIARSASCLDVLVPEDGIPMLCQQESKIEQTLLS